MDSQWVERMDARLAVPRDVDSVHVRMLGTMRVHWAASKATLQVA